MMNELTLEKLGSSITTGDIILEFSYLLAAVLFVIGLKLLSHPETARKGNFWAGTGMVLAMITTLLLHRDGESGAGIPLTNAMIIIVAIVVGSIIGVIVARKVKMTAMPQLVSLFNASGGAASALVALIEYSNPQNSSALVTLLGLIIGAVAFSGSMIAYGKLDGKVGDIFSSIMTYVNLLILAAIVILTVYMLIGDVPFETQAILVYILLGLSLLYGVMFVMPIGGADMPVVISLLNSFTGIAAAMAGFIYNNQAMILGGIFVGSAGTILTVLMCRAMNRSLLNVIIGAFGGGGAAAGDTSVGTIKEIGLSDAAVLLSYTQKVVIVPGYGLAVAQ
ncbi:MAG: NAD(P)(+) transhydrogenase (Re/Si-specific) subunit beta, partial [Bacteroidota bacterium]